MNRSTQTLRLARAGRVATLGLGLLILAWPAGAFIERIYPLADVLNECTHIGVGGIETTDPKAKTAILKLERPLKGRLEFNKVNFNIGLGPGPHANYMVPRIAPGMPAILYYKRDGQNIASLVHVGGNWYQFYATDNPKARDKVWWRFTHVEIKMGRTYDGPTEPLIKLTEDVLAKRVPAPKPDPKVPPVDVNRPATLAVQTGAGGKKGGFFRQNAVSAKPGGEVRGISFADVNNDGALDAYFCRQQGNLLLINQGKSFKECAADFGVGHGSRSAAWADFNGDGRPDLLLGDFRMLQSIDGKYKHRPELLAMPGSLNPEGLGWIDGDNDGWPDALISNGEHGIWLYRNPGGDGKGKFQDISDRSGLGPKGAGKGNGDFVALFDFDGDGRSDFFYNYADGLLFRNSGNGRFEMQADTGLKLAGSSDYKRGLAVADYDNDGDRDVFMPGPERPLLYRNENNGRFADVTSQAGDLAKIKGPSFSGAWADVNGDGWLDLLICVPTGASRLLLSDGKGGFTDVSREVGVDTLGKLSAAEFADLDNDGDADLAGNAEDKVVIAFNDLPKPEGHQPVALRLSTRKGAIGAVVRVLDQSGRLMGMRDVQGGGSCGGQPETIARFHLPPGEYRIYAALSDGRLGHKQVALAKGQAPGVLSLEEKDFK